MNPHSIVTAAFFALVPAAIVAFVVGMMVGGAPQILEPTDPLAGTGSGVKQGSTGSPAFWQAFFVSFAVVEVIAAVVIARILGRSSGAGE